MYPYPQDTPRSYRNTLKHSSADTGSGNPTGQADPALSRPDSLSADLNHLIQGHPFIAGGLLSQMNPSWPHVDPMITMPISAGNENRMSQSNFASHSCTCNSETGPCPDHLEKIRTQVLAGASSPLPLHQQLQNQHAPYPDMSAPHQPPQTPLSRYNSSRSSESHQQPLYIDRPTKRSAHSPSTTPLISGSCSSMSSHMYTPNDPSPTTSVAAPPEPPRAETKLAVSSAVEADITQRFGIVLETMRRAGFQDFDVMALAYYTSKFEKDSLPSMLQGASRSRRVKAMLQELHESSRKWQRWESRGLNEGISEATATRSNASLCGFQALLCVEEMERLDKVKVPSSAQGDPASLITAFEWLLSEHECSTQSDRRDEGSLWGQLEAAPDSMPYLWSLLTELAGAQGLYCDKAARIVLAILLYTRGTQRETEQSRNRGVD
ncbi:hypothetical protein N431DRAFT_564490 [Stipitochalara longipes BDJ]|nr:hypothetical protein N431DRAFT_564490 [Stipitochalara longipes BDJ]